MFFKKKNSEFICVTSNKGTIVYIRKTEISCFFRVIDGGYTRLLLNGNDLSWDIKETVDELKNKLLMN